MRCKFRTPEIGVFFNSPPVKLIEFEAFLHECGIEPTYISTHIDGSLLIQLDAELPFFSVGVGEALVVTDSEHAYCFNNRAARALIDMCEEVQVPKAAPKAVRRKSRR